MGKDWYWAGSRSSKSKRGGAAETQIPSGCMSAVFQAFDFHPFHFSLNKHQQSSFKSASHIPQDLQSVPKGAEAPRNSLESEDGTVSSVSKEKNLKVPKNIRTKASGNTRARAGNLNDISSEIISSPGTKTPTLVARLMGLDLLPEAHSSSSSSSSCLSTPNQQGHPHVHHLRPRQHIQVMKHRNSTGSYNNAAIRSLHETPRRSDVEHRLSLQINKENMGLGEDLDLPRFSFSKRKYDENNYSKSPSHYARQIVKQVKESVSRKVGLDITNTVKSREREREEFVGQLRFKKSLKTSVKSLDESSPGKHSNSSHSPRLRRFMDTKHKPSTKPSSPLTPKDQNTNPKPPSPPHVVNVEAQLISRVLTKAKPQALPELELQNQKQVPKCKKITNEKLSSRLNKLPQTSSIRKKQQEAFIIRPPPSPTRANNDIKAKSKRTHPLPSNLLNNLHTVPNLLPVKTDASPPATKIPQKQSQLSDTREPKRSTQLSSCSRQRYKQETTHTLATNDEDKFNGVSTTTTGADAEGPEYQYIATILSRTGPHKATLVRPHFPFQWFSPFHPLDPSIFHQLEHYPTSNSTVFPSDNDKDNIFSQKNQLGPRCNRRLLFDLVDEVLSEIPVRPKYCYRGMLLLETVWKRVRSFPRAKCEVLEDIDGLIEMKEEEGEEGLVAEIEGNILETLVHETVTVMVGGVELRCMSGSVRRRRRRLDHVHCMVSE